MNFILQSLKHYWKGHIGLLIGAFLASAILSGSLVIGDSVRASLKRVAEQRLGKIQSGVVGGDRWFSEALAKKIDGVPVIQIQGSASAATGGSRANGVQVLGVNEAFWSLSPAGKAVVIANDEAVVNEPMARRLGVKAGDTIVVRVEKPSAISRDAPLSGSTNEQITLRRKIASVVSDGDFGAYQLAASQRTSDTVFLPLSNLQVQLEREAKINLVLSSTSGPAMESVKPMLEDFALQLRRHEKPNKEWELSTDRVFLDEAITTKLLKQTGAYGVLTYLVNGITSAKGGVPYSMVTATDGVKSETRNPNADGAIITQWLAEDQKLVVGDAIELRYFVVGIGRELKEEKAAFKVSEILPMSDPRVNRDWTPEFPGVSDVDNCRDWEPGIPMDMKAIRDQDEKYWDDYKGTPKVFIPLAAGQKLWSNRFGSYTAIRFPDTGQSEEQVRETLLEQLKLSDIGLVAGDFKGDADAAAKGSVDFGGLFIGLSMFLIAAALIFAALLFLFMMEKRAPQVGLLLAMGWSTQSIRRAIIGEAGLVALAGTLLGLAGGVLYTKVALRGLSGAWSDAAQGLELVYHARPLTLIIAFVAAFGIALLTLWLASRKLFKTPATELMQGATASSRLAPKAGNRRSLWLVLASLALAMVLAVSSGKATNPQALAGMFFGAGALLMIAGLGFASIWMKRGAAGQRLAGSVWQIGARNVSRRPSRSLAVLGMMAGGIFLVMAVNVFRMGVDADATKRESGTGGFALIGESSLPVYEDLNKPAAWDAFGLDEEIMKQASVVPFRVREGDDASCLNLNRAQNPVLVGVDAKKLAERKAFRFVGNGSWESIIWLTNDQKYIPPGVNEALYPDDPIPAIADQATAMWGLGKGVGDVLEYQDSKGRLMKVQIVGLLAGSVLQGKMIIDERAFLERFPDAAGYKFLLIDAAPDKTKGVSEELTKQLEARGLALEPAADRLAAFNSVQNTYIGIFTVLGGLGVLLGTAGLGVLLARHVLERKGELGLMQALGFKQNALRGMILGEHVLLLLGGVLLGLVSAALAVWPCLRQGGSDLPFSLLTWLLAGIAGFGFIVCALAAYLAVRGRLLEAIRRE